MKDAALPITLIVVGVIWLCWHFGWFRDVDWIISIGFIAGGIAVLVMDRITKNSIVVGPLLIATGLAWAAHDRYRVSWSLLIPVLLVLVGILMLVARSAAIPDRRIPRTKAEEPRLP
jgi:hypothetical protein